MTLQLRHTGHQRAMTKRNKTWMIATVAVLFCCFDCKAEQKTNQHQSAGKFFTALIRGVHPSEAMMHGRYTRGNDAFPPVSDLSPISEKNFRLQGKLKVSRCSFAKISDDLLLFSLFQYIFHLFQENYYFPYFCKFPPDFVKFTCFLHSLCVFRLPL